MADANLGIPILMYHEVAEPAAIEALARKTQRGYILSTTDFERQMNFLRAQGFSALSLPQATEALAHGAPLANNSVVITFDDGFAGNYHHALPILARCGFTATFFVVSNRIGEPPMMQASELRALVSAGMSVQSHTANHPLLSTLDRAQTRAELIDSKNTIEQTVGAAVNYLSLPNGDHNEFYPALARACGYAGGCASVFGFNQPGVDPYFLRRIAIKQALSQQQFERIVMGDARLLAVARFKAGLKSSVAALLGKRTYDRLYNLAFGVDEQDKRKQ